MNRTLATLIACLTLAAAAGVASADPPGVKDHQFGRLLFTPELIMKHQAAIDLTADQRRALIAEITAAQADFLPDQMEVAEHAEELKRLLAGPRVDEAAAMEVAARVLELESRIKQRHLTLAIRIKNLLDATQQARLMELRTRRRRPNAGAR